MWYFIKDMSIKLGNFYDHLGSYFVRLSEVLINKLEKIIDFP